MLPEDEFEEIRTRKRIVEEGFVQRNCVASYAEYINHDECAIYSFISPLDHKRYTLEFRMRKGKYYLRQAHCQYNKGCPNSVIKYIQSFLKQ